MLNAHRCLPPHTAMAAVAACLCACGGGPEAPPVVAPKVTAEDSILAVSERFSAISEDRRLLSPPSAVAIHQRQSSSTLSLSRGKPLEQLRITQHYEFRDGRVTDCVAAINRPLKATFEFVQGEATVTLAAAPAPLAYRCTAGTPAELSSTLDGATWKLVLRDETLVVVAPAADRRRFLPTAE
jgi:hypothetical protein